MSINQWIFKYGVYYPVVLARGEWLTGHLKELMKSQYGAPEQLQLLQLNRLNTLIQHAKRTVPFYSNLPDLPLQSLGELSQLPLLEKDDLRSDPARLWSSVKGYMIRQKTTGGSTGAAVTIRKDCRGMAHELAATWRGYHWAGINIGDKQARFWGVPQQKKDYWRSRLIDLVTNRMRLSAFSFSDEDLASYVKKLEAFKPVYFYGYVSMIKQLADFLERRGQTGTLTPKAVVTTSEVLLQQDRDQISRVFGCKVYDEYGCGEVGTIAHECEYGSMHITAENIIVEIVDEAGQPVAPGLPGEIVVTDLVNFSMPLIRYRIKDFATMATQPCPCGRGLPVLSNIHGREYDMLLNSKGQKFHGEFFLYMVEELKNRSVRIDAFQVGQDSELNLIIRLGAGQDAFEESCSYLETELHKRFDERVIVHFERVTKIEREPSGKLRVIKRLGW